jgi:prolyl oligopeptidase
LLDMLRFEKIAAGASWVGEYGSVSVPEQRAFLADLAVQQPQAGVKVSRAVHLDDDQGRSRRPAARAQVRRASRGAGIPYLFYEVGRRRPRRGRQPRGTRAHDGARDDYFIRLLMGGA